MLESYQINRYNQTMILKNFIVFEGIDGSGTSTQITELKRKFDCFYTQDSNKPYFTFEPTDNAIGTLIRKALSESSPLCPKSLAYLFAADRAEHLYGENGIIDRSKKGQLVISDRYFFSSLAYQGEATSSELSYTLNASFPLPEHLFYFDIDPEISMDRVNSRSHSKEIYEKVEFQKLVRARYRVLISEYQAKKTGMHIHTIDATQSISEITEYIWSLIQKQPKI